MKRTLMKPAGVLTALVIAAASLTLGTAAAKGSHGVRHAAEEDRIVYSSRSCPAMEDYGSAQCTFEIFSVGLDGGAPEQILSTFGTDDILPTYSPDGSEIAFISWDKALGCDSHVWLMGSDGSDPLMVSSPVNAWEESIGWTPNGKIAFTHWPNDPACQYGFHGDLHLLSRSGDLWSQEPLLTRPGTEYAPTFSPDGRFVVYTFDPDDDGISSEGESNATNIWRSDADGSGPHVRLTRTRKLDENWPSWSPDGRHVAFFRGDERSPWYQSGWGHIWIMDADGSNKHRLTPKGGLDVTPVWSPDGKKIAFTRCTPAANQYDCAIAVVSLARPDHIRIVADREGYMDIHPSWAPATS